QLKPGARHSQKDTNGRVRPRSTQPRGREWSVVNNGRAGEIRTRGLLVPNQALCRAKLPPAAAAGEIQTDRRSSAPEASIALTARARWLYRAFSSVLISPNVRPASGTRNTGS